MRRIKMLRESKKLMQKELAKELGISPSALSHYENGEREPDIKTLTKLADFFNVSIDFIIGRSDESLDIIDPVIKQVFELSTDSKKELEKFAALLELKEKQDKINSEFASDSLNKINGA